MKSSRRHDPAEFSGTFWNSYLVYIHCIYLLVCNKICFISSQINVRLGFCDSIIKTCYIKLWLHLNVVDASSTYVLIYKLSFGADFPDWLVVVAAVDTEVNCCWDVAGDEWWWALDHTEWRGGVATCVRLDALYENKLIPWGRNIIVHTQVLLNSSTCFYSTASCEVLSCCCLNKPSLSTSSWLLKVSSMVAIWDWKRF